MTLKSVKTRTAVFNMVWPCHTLLQILSPGEHLQRKASVKGVGPADLKKQDFYILLTI
jgi:hypothetical protein